MKKISNIPGTPAFLSRVLFMISLLVMTLGYVSISMAQVVDTLAGPNYAGEAVSETVGDDREWVDPENALADDGEFTRAGPFSQSGRQSEYLNLWDYEFDIPASATITGIKMEVNHRVSTTGSGTNLQIQDETVQLLLNGERIGDNLAKPENLPINSFEIAEYGGPNDMWNASLTRDDIVSPDFGASIRYEKATAPQAGDVDVDWVRLTVYYEVDEGPAYVTLGGPQNVTAGEISDEMILTVFDYEGEAAEVEADTDFDLTSTSGGNFTFYSDQNGSNQITSVIVQESASSATFYYRDDEAGDQTVTATWNAGNTGAYLGFAEHEIAVLPADASVVEVYTQPDPTQTAGMPLTGIPAARVMDAFDNPVGDGVEVTAAAQTGAGELTASSDNNVITDNDGVAIFSNLIIEIADDYHLLFSIDENDNNVASSDTAQSDSFTVEATGAYQFAFVNSPVDNELVAGEPGSFTVEIQDEFENPTIDHTGYNDIISIDPVAGTFLPVSVDIANGETSATFTWEHTEAGFYTLTADADGVDSDEITVEVVAADAEQLAFADQPQDAVSGEVLDPVTIRIEDEFANLIGDATDMITVALTDAGDADLGGTLEVAAVDGIATFSDLNVDLAGSYTLTATSDELNDAVSDEFTISAGDPDAQLSEISADPATITTEESSEITVSVTDGSGNAVGSGFNVYLSTNLGELDDDVATYTGTTDGNGLVQVDLTSSTTGTATVSAWLGSDDSGDSIGQVDVTVEAGAPDAVASTINADPTTITTDDSSEITVSVTDGSGNAVGSGFDVFLSTNLGELDADVATYTSTTDGNGLVEVDLTSSTTGTATVTAWLGTDENGDYIGEVNVTVTPGGADATLSSISADPATITTEESSEITVSVTDGSGNAVGSGFNVYLSTNLGELDDDVATYTGTTDGNGLVQVDLTSSTTGTATVSAWLGSDDSGDSIGQVDVTVEAGAPDAVASTINADPTTITTDEFSLISVMVTDGGGNPVGAGYEVFLSTSFGNFFGTGATYSNQTDGNGQVNISLSSSSPGDATVTAYLGNNTEAPMIDQVTVVIIPAPQPMLSANPNALQFEYLEGEGPSFSQVFEVSGENLEEFFLYSNQESSGNTSNIIAPFSPEISILASDHFEVSLNDTDFHDEVTIDYSGSGGELQNEQVYVRMIEGLAIGTYGIEEITIMGGGASPVFVEVSGEVLDPTTLPDPVLAALPNQLHDFSYRLDHGGPDTSSFAVVGENLRYFQAVGEVKVSVTSGEEYFEISMGGSEFSSSLGISYLGRSFEREITVRFKSGLEYGEYEGEITVSGGGAPRDKNVSLFGEVLPPEFDEAESISEVIGGNTGDYFRISGEVVTTFIYLGDDLNRHFISDGTSALVIYDAHEVLGSDFAVGDGMEGLRGQLLVDSETRYLAPWDNPGVSSTGNDLPAMSLQLVDFNTDEHQSWLVDISAVEFFEEGVFEDSTHYSVTDPSLTVINGDAVRLTTFEFADSLDYIGEAIPADMVNMRAMVTEDTGTPQLTALSIDDMPILAPAFDVEFVNLQWPISAELVSGESEMAYGRIFVPEVTDDDIEVEGLTAWLGIHNENTDPAGWNESVWTQMEFNAAGSDAAYDEYMAELNMMVPGKYYYATRFIAGEADTLYGGTSDDEGQFGRGGFWNGEDFVSGELTVTGVEAENIAELLEVAEVGSGINYTINDEVYLVFNSDFRNRKVVVDPSGGIVLDDFNGILSTEFNRYDGLTGLTGSVSEFNGLIQFVPQLPVEEASSSDNSIYPNRVSNLAEIDSTRQGELVYIEGVSFSESGQFANQTNYTLVDAAGNELVMRTDRIEESILYDGEETYIGTQIPQDPVNLVGYVGMFNDPQLTVRKLGDIIDPDAIAAFDLLSPADAGDELESVMVQGGENEVVSITWQSAESDLDINYRWIAQLPGLYHTPPALDLPSDEEGAQASLTFTIRELDEVLEASGIGVGNELVVNWTIVAEDTGSEAFRYASEHRTVVLQRGTVTSSRGLADLPTEVGLKQNYPNPFNPVTTISYQLPADMHVELRVYNLLGQEVATLVNEQVSAGTHEVSFDGSRLSSGVYIYRLQAGGKAITNRMTLVK